MLATRFLSLSLSLVVLTVQDAMAIHWYKSGEESMEESCWT